MCVAGLSGTDADGPVARGESEYISFFLLDVGWAPIRMRLSAAFVFIMAADIWFDSPLPMRESPATMYMSV